jgi:hypothetical protein
VALSFNGQQYTQQDVDFYYYAVWSIVPSHGPLDGSTVVSVSGPNLDKGMNDQAQHPPIHFRFYCVFTYIYS